MSKLQLIAYSCILTFAGIVIGSIVGNNYGRTVVQSKWNKSIAQDLTLTVKASEQSRLVEAEHTKESNEVANNANISKTQYDADIASITSIANSRLQQSEARANTYYKMSKASAAEQKHLAEYTSKLDNSITEGRQLVEELRATLAERERTIHNLADQLNTDRKLMNEY